MKRLLYSTLGLVSLCWTLSSGATECVESPSGQMLCDVIGSRDQNPTGVNAWHLMPNNEASGGSMCPPAAFTLQDVDNRGGGDPNSAVAACVHGKAVRFDQLTTQAGPLPDAAIPYADPNGRLTTMPLYAQQSIPGVGSFPAVILGDPNAIAGYDSGAFPFLGSTVVLDGLPGGYTIWNYNTPLSGFSSVRVGGTIHAREAAATGELGNTAFGCYDGTQVNTLARIKAYLSSPSGCGDPDAGYGTELLLTATRAGETTPKTMLTLGGSVGVTVASDAGDTAEHSFNCDHCVDSADIADSYTNLVYNEWSGPQRWSVDGAQCTKVLDHAIVSGGPQMTLVQCTDNDTATVYLPSVFRETYNDLTFAVRLIAVSDAAAPSGVLAVDWECECLGLMAPFTGSGEARTTLTFATQYKAEQDITADMYPPKCGIRTPLFCRGQVDATGTTVDMTHVYMIGASVH